MLLYLCVRDLIIILCSCIRAYVTYDLYIALLYTCVFDFTLQAIYVCIRLVSYIVLLLTCVYDLFVILRSCIRALVT